MQMIKIIFKIYSFLIKNSGTNQYYFFLPNIGNGFTSEILITNHSQNSTAPEKFIDLFIALHAFDHKLNVWKLVDKVKFNASGIIKISSKKYTKNKGDLVVASIHKINQIMHEFSSSLPQSDIKKNDFSPHSVRCRLLFRKEESFSSYMSEYPKKMTFVKNGSAFSFGHLLSHQDSLASTTIAFINISDTEVLSPNTYMKLINIETGKTILTKKIFNNKVAVHTLRNNKIKNKSLALITQGLAGIPIYISQYRNKLGQLRISCEHSHPPSEYFFENAAFNQKNMKINWFKKLL